jgi:cobyrinic acid a,c-diamide synthase
VNAAGSPARPRGLVVAAPRSGSGKTSVTLGLIAALRRRGLAVAAAKAGPDYIDTAFHAAATGRPGVNLDTWSMRAGLLDALAATQAEGADVMIVEGLMGLFDGVASAGACGDGSTADLAARLGLPVLLVLDVSGQSQTAGAVAKGFATYRPDVTVAGVVLNRVASPRHTALASRGVAAAGLPVLGALPRTDGLSVPERHLGLVQAEEHERLDAFVAELGDFVAANCDLDAILAAARPLWAEGGAGSFSKDGLVAAGLGSAGSVAAPTAGAEAAGSPSQPISTSDAVALPPPGQRIALARDAAFSFVYPHLLAGWKAAGAEIVPFSPLADEVPDADADVCWLSGGYPELHAGRLAGNARFLDGLRAFAASKPVHGECGGHMVLGEGIEDADGVRHAMAGLLGHATSFAKRRLHLGYRRAILAEACLLGPAGAGFRGHEFHYASVTEAGGDAPLFAVTDANGATVADGSGGRRGGVTGSFFHLIDRG